MSEPKDFRLLSELNARDLKPLREECIRRKKKRPPKLLYFFSKRQMATRLHLKVYCSPTNGRNETDKALILDKKYSNAAEHLLSLAVDEVSERLYVMYGQSDGQLVKGTKFLRLKIYHLESVSSSTGYQTVSVKPDSKSRGTLLTVQNVSNYYVVQIFLDPVSGHILLQGAAQDRRTYITSHRLGVLPLTSDLTAVPDLSSSPFFPGHREPISRCLIRKGSKLLVAFKPLPHDHLVALDEFGRVDPNSDDLLWEECGGFAAFDISRKGGQMTLKFDRSFFPTYTQFLNLLGPPHTGNLTRLLNCTDSRTSERRKELGENATHVGMVHKYHLFTFPRTDTTVVAVKNLHKVILGEWQSVTVSEVFDLSEALLTRGMEHTEDINSAVPCPEAKWVVDGEFMSQIVMYSMDGSHVKNPRSIVYGIGLQENLKDYRCCAKCGVREKSKRRLKNGKRCSRFKVCRICKEQNLHLYWRKFSCHYCSDACMKSDWKQHKRQHSANSKTPLPRPDL